METILDVEMWASSGCMHVGDKVHLRATVSNRGPKPQTIDLKDTPVLDIVFGNPDAGPRWSDGRPLTPDLTRLELKPGESKSIEMDWVAEYGTKNITAVFRTDRRFPPLEPGVTINVGTCAGFLGP
jgi:Intracellular proteinase inhibitor